ncbi:hypothetical protein CAEBREN_24033 [Caenorhabditis brenneri]|uniref:Zinc finger CCCH domain-containing protein 14 n=1 Tax=Caenorhabditis brenneri TaxID=135651 RepID=G0MTL2_CAEBE|nr:hypothetical protein CAEBREN_24033 [Caenorhabditis brenneri]
MSSQTGTSEVSKKLKAAIRAKLEELGVYVDDELPDYIMVMIANKKEKVQMKEDLNLFIGKSTGKFVDWLFDLFDRLQNASNKQGETSKKEEESKKEQEVKEQEEKRQKEKEDREKEREKEQLKEKERERERQERQKERDRAKRVEEEKRREEKRKEILRSKRRRSRSNTYSDDEEHFARNDRHAHRDTRDKRTREERSSASGSNRQPSTSPEKRLQSTVVVKRNIRPTGDKNVRGRGTMFLRAMNEASVSAGYGSSKNESAPEDIRDEDDMSDVEALPTKSSRSPKKSVHERLSRVNKVNSETTDDDTVVLGNQPQSGGPQMILKMTGGKDAIKKTRIQDRIVVPDDNLRRGLLKRRVGDPAVTEEPRSKHERIVFDVSRSHDSTPTDDSPTMQKWNGQIEIGDSDESADEEAEIDAFVAEARGINRRDSVMEEDEIPPTHQLSGATYAVHIPEGYSPNVPAYIPTPLSVLNEQQNQIGAGIVKDHHVKERCVFWPKCTKGDSCAFFHPTTNCKNFPNCTFGIRCLFIHPPCRFDRYCTKKHCPYTHHGTGGVQPGVAPEIKYPLSSNRMSTESATSTLEELPKPTVRGALGSLAEKLAASIKKKPVVQAEKKEEQKTDENETATPEKVEPITEDSPTTKSLVKAVKELSTVNSPLQSMIPCRYAGGCRNPICHFKHPKECRFGANCRNPSCYFYHKPSSAPSAPTATSTSTESGAAAKYKWTATAN